MQLEEAAAMVGEVRGEVQFLVGQLKEAAGVVQALRTEVRTLRSKVSEGFRFLPFNACRGCCCVSPSWDRSVRW